MSEAAPGSRQVLTQGKGGRKSQYMGMAITVACSNFLHELLLPVQHRGLVRCPDLPQSPTQPLLDPSPLLDCCHPLTWPGTPRTGSAPAG
jgi:hypothetical protein